MAGWTIEAIATRRATGDGLVTAGDWAVSYDTTTEVDGSSSGTKLSATRYALPTLAIIERDPRDGEVFATVAEAECYALNAGRVQWYRDTPTGKP